MAEAVLGGGSLLHGNHIKELAGFDECSAASPDAWRPKPLTVSDPMGRVVRQMFDERIATQQHAFRLATVELSTPDRDRIETFKRVYLRDQAESEMMMLYHGTNLKSHDSILRDGFIESKIAGNTDVGYIGRGFYLTPDIEYSMSYIRQQNIALHKYENPVPWTGTVVKVLGVLAVLGKTQFAQERELGVEMPDGYTARYAFVDRGANVIRSEQNRFATEIVVDSSTRLLPRFVLTTVRVNKEVIWLDPNIDNAENSRYAEHFYAESKNAHVYCTKNEQFAMSVLKQNKATANRRIVTAGRGGEEFVRKLRGPSCRCQSKILVFCQSVAYHRGWASKFSNIEVTAKEARFKEFVEWK